MKKIKNILGIAGGLVLAIGPYTFLHVCGENMKMGSEMGDMEMGSMAAGPACHGIPVASLITGIALVLISIISLIASAKAENSSDSKIDTFLDFVRIILGVVAIGIPTFIVGVCESVHMHCHMVTRPALILIGVVVGLTGVISLAYSTLANTANETKTLEKVASEA